MDTQEALPHVPSDPGGPDLPIVDDENPVKPDPFYQGGAMLVLLALLALMVWWVRLGVTWLWATLLGWVR